MVAACEARGNLVLLHLSRRTQIPLVLEILHDDLHRVLHTSLSRLDVDLRLQGLLIRRANPRELGDLALSRLLVQALWIPLLRDINRHVNPYLDERHALLAAGALRLVQLPRQVAVRTVRADEARDSDGARIGEEFGHLGDAADVLLAVLGREAEVLVEAEADVVAVEAVGIEVDGTAEERLFEGDGDGGFATGAEPREPDRQALLAAERGPDGRGYGGGMVGDVAGHDRKFEFGGGILAGHQIVG